ncbi:MC/SLC25 family protein [Kocuria palustris]|nr:MC/SLC25 family protein [Kocuria palustris]
MTTLAEPHVLKLAEEIDYEALPEDASVAAHLAAGAFAGIMEHTVMFPLDSIKTRMQMIGLGQLTTLSLSVLALIRKISLAEGARSLWRGVLLVVLGAGPAHAVYFSVFEATKTQLVNSLTNSPKTNKIVTDENHPMIASLAGVAATVALDALMNPFDVIKQRMQALSAEKKVGQQLKDFLKTAASIYRNEGFGTFYLSYPTTLITNIPFNSLNFGFYELSLQMLNPEGDYNPWAHCLAGGIAGGTAAALTTPLDCIKTLLQTKGLSERAEVRLVTGFWLGAKVLYRLEGLSGFTKGLKPRVLFNIPASAICWTSYQLAKEVMLR